LFQLDEFGLFLRDVSDPKSPQHLKSIESDLLKLYTASDSIFVGRAYADSDRTPVIDQPHCVILGSCTSSTLWSAITSRQVEAGLLGRLQVLEERNYVPLVSPLPYGDLMPPAAILEAVEWWLDFVPSAEGNLGLIHAQPKTLTMTQAAKKKLEDHLYAISDRRIHEDPMQAAIWSRSGEKASKLTMLAACARKSWEITIEDVTWGIQLQNYLTRRLCSGCQTNIAENSFDRAKKRIIKILRSSGRISASELCKRTQFIRGRNERNNIYQDLIDSGDMLMVFEVEGHGRKKYFQHIPEG